MRIVWERDNVFIVITKTTNQSVTFTSENNKLKI